MNKCTLGCYLIVKNEEEKRHNAEMAFKCKMIIEMHY